MSFLEQDKLLRVDFDKLNKKAAYGTAGFRDLAVNMPYVQLIEHRSLLGWEYSWPFWTKLSPTNI